MQVTREDLNPCTVKLTIVPDESQVKDGFERAVKQISKQIKVPGFRPGHAPKAMVEGLINPDNLLEQAGENIVKSTFKKALEEQELQPYQNPSVDLTKIERESLTCEYVMKVPLKPVVELGEYKGLEIERPSADVTDEEVESQLEELRKRKGTREAITGRGVQEGDVAVVNIKIDGEEGDGRNFMTIAGQTFPQLDQALMGMQVEEMKSLDLTFPENFQEKDWAGKPFHCQVTLRSLSNLKLPELDEDFAQGFRAENVEDLRTRLKESMQVAKANMVQEYVNEQLLENLMNASTVHVPDNMWEGVASQRLREYAEEQGKKGKSLQQYAEENGMTIEQFVDALKHDAEMHVKRAVVVREIAEKEEIKLTNMDLNEELFLMAREYEVQPDEMLEMLKKNQALEELQFRAIFRKVTQFLSEHATAREVAPA